MNEEREQKQTTEFTVNIAYTIMTTWGWVEAGTVAMKAAKEALSIIFNVG